MQVKVDKLALIDQLVTLPAELKEAQATALRRATDYRMKALEARARAAAAAAASEEELVALKTAWEAAANAVKATEQEIACLVQIAGLLMIEDEPEESE